MIAAGLVRKLYDGIKILGNGALDRPLTIKAHRWSKSAYDKVVAAGGTIESI